MDSMSIRLPYKNLRHDADMEVEMMNFEEEANRRIESDNHNRFSKGNASNSPPPSQGPPAKNCSLITLILSCTVAAGVQFGWALQLSLLTPYIQTLGIGHAFSSYIWLCGPITGLVKKCKGLEISKAFANQEIFTKIRTHRNLGLSAIVSGPCMELGSWDVKFFHL